MGKFREVV
jgi:hypothetical protein